MTSSEKIKNGLVLMSEGMAEIITLWGQELVKVASRLAEACCIEDSDDLTLAKAMVSGAISPRAYSVASRGRRWKSRKKWLSVARRKVAG